MYISTYRVDMLSFLLVLLRVSITTARLSQMTLLPTLLNERSEEALKTASLVFYNYVSSFTSYKYIVKYSCLVADTTTILDKTVKLVHRAIKLFS